MLDLLVILFYFLMKKGNLKRSFSELLFHATVAFKIKRVQKEKRENGNLVLLTTVVLEQSTFKCCIKIKEELLNTRSIRTDLVAYITEGKCVRNDTNCSG